jgi:hypothetical protein
MNHVRDRALRSGEGGEVCFTVAPLPVGAGRGRSSGGFSALFTLSREMDEKRIERDVRGVGSSIVSQINLFFTM